MQLEMQNKHQDLAVQALDALEDIELDACQEYLELQSAGYRVEEIQETMQDRWAIFRRAETAINARYDELIKAQGCNK
jgi:hypothetical protein